MINCPGKKEIKFIFINFFFNKASTADICEATRGACVVKTTCTKKLISNFCQNQGSSIMCCV